MKQRLLRIFKKPQAFRKEVGVLKVRGETVSQLMSRQLASMARFGQPLVVAWK